MNEKTYYSLRLLGTNAFHVKGDILKTTNKILQIGETADCEIRYESGLYEPELYASIIENKDGRSWRLIQRSQHVKAQIAGCGGFGYVHQLKDGDIISFEGQKVQLEFHTYHDCNYGHTGVIIEQHTSKRMIYGLLAAIVAVLFILTYFVFDLRLSGIKNEDLIKYYSSIYITKVDSVQWVRVIGNDTSFVHSTMILESSVPSGTAFLTKDGKLITARHCIEFWIGDTIDLTEDVEQMRDDDIKKWAILSESFMMNRESKDESQLLRVFFSIYEAKKPDDPIFSFCSTDTNVHINRCHDGILPFADFNNDYYWRTIQPYYSDLETELGDIVYIDIDRKGTIEIADSVMISQLNQSSEIAILGHPNSSSGKNITFASGRITEDRCDTLNRFSPDLKFDANITHGFSGGPVFVKSNGRIVVIGVVSKTDIDNGIYKKAVPITEVKNMEKGIKL